jgi:hypothetical protein
MIVWAVGAHIAVNSPFALAPELGRVNALS